MRLSANRLVFLTSLVLLAATVAGQLHYTLAGIHDFNWLAYLDGDLIYQVERFLVNMKYPGVVEINSSLADYGSEFSLLTPFFHIVSPVLPGHGPIQAYYFLILVHLGCGIIGLVLLWRLLLRFFHHPPSAALFLALCVSSNLFIHNLAFLKPDASVILLCLAGSLWLLCRFLETKRSAWLVLSLAAAGLGAAVKWWGVFMLFPTAYVLSDLDDLNGRQLAADLVAVFFPLVCLTGLVLYLINPVAGPLTEYLLNALAGHGSVVTAEAIRTLLFQPIRPPFPWRGGLPVLLAGCCLAAMAIAVLLWRGRLSGDWLAKRGSCVVVRLVAAGLPLAFFTLVCDAPLLMSSQVFVSLKDYGSYNVLGGGRGAMGSESLLGTIAGNCWGWVTDAFVSGFFSPFVLTALVFAGYLALRGLRDADLNRRLRCQAWFLFPILAFLFLIVTKKNWATQAMLWPLILCFLFTAIQGWLAELAGKAGRIARTAVLVLVVVQIGQNLLAKPNIFDFYGSRRGLAEEVVRINASLDGILRRDGGTGMLYLINRDFPIALTDWPYRQVKHDAFDLQLAGIITRAAPGDIFVLDTHRITPEVQPLLEGLDPLSTIRGKRFQREGVVAQEALFRVYRKPGPRADVN